MQHPSAGSSGSAAGRRVRLTALALTALHLALVSWLALRPLSVVWVAPGSMRPFATIGDELARGPLEAVPTIGAGMLRLAPLGVLLPLLGRDLGGSRFMSFGRTVFAGAAVSLALEYCQSMVPSRVADIDSVILDTAGVALAHQLAYRWLRTLTSGRTREPRSGLLPRPPRSVPPPTGPAPAARRRPDPWRARRVAQRPTDHDALVLGRLHA